jgi:hypothetical protein
MMYCFKTDHSRNSMVNSLEDCTWARSRSSMGSNAKISTDFVTTSSSAYSLISIHKSLAPRTWLYNWCSYNLPLKQVDVAWAKTPTLLQSIIPKIQGATSTQDIHFPTFWKFLTCRFCYTQGLYRIDSCKVKATALCTNLTFSSYLLLPLLFLFPCDTLPP